MIISTYIAFRYAERRCQFIWRTPFFTREMDRLEKWRVPLISTLGLRPDGMHSRSPVGDYNTALLSCHCLPYPFLLKTDKLSRNAARRYN